MINEILNIPDLRVLKDEPLKKHSSYKIGGKALAIVVPQSRAALEKVLEFCKYHNVPMITIGRASNILFPDHDLEKVVIKIDPEVQFLNNICLKKHFSKQLVNVGSGVSKSEFLNFSIKNSIKNFTFLAGIPGTIGGGLKMNSGISNKAFEHITKSFLTINLNGEEKVYKNPKDLFEYRKLNIPQDEIILEADFYVQKGSFEDINREVERIVKIRKSTHPLNYPNCGSVFKNPPDAPAGLLIEKNNLKGYTIGGAQISMLHGNFIINMGDATSMDVKNLINHIKEIIKKNENIDLKEELIVLD